MITSSSSWPPPRIHSSTSSAGRPSATASFSLSESKPTSRRRRSMSRPSALSVPRSSSAFSFDASFAFLSSSFFASAIVRRPLFFVAHGRRVARVLNLLDERLLLHDRVVEINDGRLSAERHVGLLHARGLLKRLLDERGARFTVHALDVKLR